MTGNRLRDIFDLAMIGNDNDYGIYAIEFG